MKKDFFCEYPTYMSTSVCTPRRYGSRCPRYPYERMLSSAERFIKLVSAVNDGSPVHVSTFYLADPYVGANLSIQRLQIIIQSQY